MQPRLRSAVELLGPARAERTGRTVTVVVPGQDVHDRVAPGHSRDEAAWLNDHPGAALVRIDSGRGTLGCLSARYRRGQQHAAVVVSDVKPCPRWATARH